MSCEHGRAAKREQLVGQPLWWCCLDCGHTWTEHSGELEFAEGQIVGLAFVLLTPRDERLPEWRIT